MEAAMARLIRILVYEGSAEALQDVLLKRSVKGSHQVDWPHPYLIREAILGDFLEAFDYHYVQQYI